MVWHHSCRQLPGMRLIATLLVLSSMLLSWGVVVEPRLIDEETATVDLPNLPSAWEGADVAVLADLQLGMWLGNTGTIERIVERLNDDPPAVVLVAGDFIYHPLGDPDGPTSRSAFGPEARARAHRLIERAVALVRPLVEAGIPTFAVLGNHDYGMQTKQAARLDWLAQDLERALEHAGIRVLINESTVVPETGPRKRPAGEPGLYLAGVGSHYAGHDDLERALRDVPSGAATLILMHHPASFDARRCGPVLAMAGHTHGGQIRVPGMPRWSWMSLMYPDEVHADGWIPTCAGQQSQLYVNRGIGFSLIPARVHAAPERTRFGLRRRAA